MKRLHCNIMVFKWGSNLRKTYQSDLKLKQYTKTCSQGIYSYLQCKDIATHYQNNVRMILSPLNCFFFQTITQYHIIHHHIHFPQINNYHSIMLQFLTLHGLQLKVIILQIYSQLMADSKLTSYTNHYLGPSLYSQSPSLLSQQQAQDLTCQITNQLQQEVNNVGRKQKTKSLVSLPTLPPHRFIDPELIRRQRFIGHFKQIQNQIKQLEANCQKFGGNQYIRSEMNNQSISQTQRAIFYKKRIQSIHGSLSLPRIPHVRGDADEDKVKIHKRYTEQAKSKSKKNINTYNKWFIRPESRFKHRKSEEKGKQSSVNKYIQKILTQGSPKREIKMQYGPTLIKNSLLKLGREPLICANTKISER